MLTAGASASCSEPLPSQGANEVCREQRVRGAAWQAPGGTSAWHSQWARGQRQGMAPLGRAGPHNMGQVDVTPREPQGSHPHGRGCRGPGGGEGQGWFPACCTAGSGISKTGMLGNGGRRGIPEEEVVWGTVVLEGWGSAGWGHPQRNRAPGAGSAHGENGS